MYRVRPKTNDFVSLYGIDYTTGEQVGPFGAYPRYDEITGAPLPYQFSAIQNGFFKDIRPSRGSWNRSNPYPVIYSTYDPSLGIATKFAGQYDDTYSV